LVEVYRTDSNWTEFVESVTVMLNKFNDKKAVYNSSTDFSNVVKNINELKLKLVTK